MGSTVCMRTNHDVTRGFNPAANDQEIRNGFASLMRSPHLFADAAQMDIAFDGFDRTGSKPKGCAHGWAQQIIDWKYPTFAFGSVILRVLLLGASAEAHAAYAPPKSPESTLTAALPAANAGSDAVVVPTLSSGAGEPDFISPAVIERARQRIRARASVNRFRSGSAQERRLGGTSVETGQQARALAGKLPLPDRVIARTIERIGYACGAVASATALEGDEPGAYKVTCTSGQSYQARPVHGRYHFRRW